MNAEVRNILFHGTINDGRALLEKIGTEAFVQLCIEVVNSEEETYGNDYNIFIEVIMEQLRKEEEPFYFVSLPNINSWLGLNVKTGEDRMTAVFSSKHAAEAFLEQANLLDDHCEGRSQIKIVNIATETDKRSAFRELICSGFNGFLLDPVVNQPGVIIFLNELCPEFWDTIYPEEFTEKDRVANRSVSFLASMIAQSRLLHAKASESYPEELKKYLQKSSLIVPVGSDRSPLVFRSSDEPFIMAFTSIALVDFDAVQKSFPQEKINYLVLPFKAIMDSRGKAKVFLNFYTTKFPIV